MDTVLIINPTSGQGKAAREKRKLLGLVSDMPHIRTALTTGPDHAISLAAQAVNSGCEQVVVAGGDGTINQVINGIGDSHTLLGIIPLGTGNVLAHDLGIPRNDVAGALEIIRAGRSRTVDLGRANGRRFLLMAGMGLDAAVVDAVSPKIKDLLGTAAYAPAAIEQLAKFSPVRFRLSFDDSPAYETDAYAVIAANCGSYAYNFKIAPTAVFDDGLLDIIVFERTLGTKLDLLTHAFKAVFQQRVPADPGMTCFRAARVRVESDPQVKMQLDGDVCGETGVDIEVLPRALRLIVP